MNDGGKGDKQRPTDHKKWSNGYDNIKWTKEEDEEFTRIQDRIGSEHQLAQEAGLTSETTKNSIKD